MGDVLAQRKQGFSVLITNLVAALIAEIRVHGAFTDDCRWSLVPVTFFAASFLLNVDATHLVDIICKVVLDQAQYVLMDPEFVPSMLLLLPKISKQDYIWGIYMNMFTDPEVKVRAWYTGSATGFGSAEGKKPAGILGRLIQYFKPISSTRSTPLSPHERWLHAEEFSVYQPNYRKIADFSGHEDLHRIYAIVVETIVMVLTSYDITYVVPEGSRWAAPSTPRWIESMRQVLGIKSYLDVVALNHAFPVRQGFAKDKRFTSSAVRKCYNPDANCPATKTSRWRPLASAKSLTAEVLCTPCWLYRQSKGTHRPQSIIDRIEANRSVEDRYICGWCFNMFEKAAKVRAVDNQSLGLRLCKSCTMTWGSHKTLIPKIGTHLTEDSVYHCKGCSVTESTKWFFEKQPAEILGNLYCNTCHYKPPGFPKAKKSFHSEREDDSLQPHKVCNEDIVRYCVTGFLHFCFVNSGIDLRPSRSEAEIKAEVARIRLLCEDIRQEAIESAQQQADIDANVAKSKKVCEPCREAMGGAKKGICDRTLPTCSRCAQHGLTCFYEGRKSRGKKPAEDADTTVAGPSKAPSKRKASALEDEDTLIEPPYLGDDSTLVHDNEDGEDEPVSQGKQRKGKGKAKA